MTITALPDPPSRDDPSTFRAKADAFFLALPTFGDELNATATSVADSEAAAGISAGTATTQASAASASAGTATTQAGIATAAAAAANGDALAAAASAAQAASFGAWATRGRQFFLMGA